MQLFLVFYLSDLVVYLCDLVVCLSVAGFCWLCAPWLFTSVRSGWLALWPCCLALCTLDIYDIHNMRDVHPVLDIFEIHIIRKIICDIPTHP